MLMLFGYSDNILSCIHCNLYSKNINPCENTVKESQRDLTKQKAIKNQNVHGFNFISQ